MLAAKLLAPTPEVTPVPVARHDVVPAPNPIPAPLPAPVPNPAPVPEVRPQLTASVTVVRKASSSAGLLKVKSELRAGDTVATAKGGELWLRLPDGSKAGLTPSSKLSISSLTDRQLDLELGEGSVVLVAKHLPQRELKVVAGELEVRDVGTRFLVSREVSRVLVAVEEGVVEVKAPGETRQVKAGHAVRWSEGQLTEEAWAPVIPVSRTKPSPLPEPAAAANETPPIPEGPAVPGQHPETPNANANAQLSPGTDLAKSGAPDAAGSKPEDWQEMPAKVGPPPEPPLQGAPVAAAGGDAAVPAPEAKVEPPSPAAEAAPEEDEPPGPLDLLKKAVNKGIGLVKKVSGSPRAKQANEIGNLADAGNCDEVLRRADEWLSAKPTDSDDEPKWKRTVKVNQLRCYRALHRNTEADAVQRELSGN